MITNLAKKTSLMKKLNVETHFGGFHVSGKACMRAIKLFSSFAV
jgi:hypothetical protein